VYDSFIDLAHHSVKPAARTAAPAKKVAAKTPAVKTTRAKRTTAPAKKAATKTAARKTTRTAAKPAARAATSRGRRIHPRRPRRAARRHRRAAQRRREGLAHSRVSSASSGSSLKLFDKLTAEFAVMQHPDRIRWTWAACPRP
jgi:hypothetical protein